MSSGLQYKPYLRKKGSFMDMGLAIMGESLKDCDTSDAAVCLLQYLFDNFDEGFKCIVKKNGITTLKD
jgi:hypothetical protein